LEFRARLHGRGGCEGFDCGGGGGGGGGHGTFVRARLFPVAPRENGKRAARPERDRAGYA